MKRTTGVDNLQRKERSLEHIYITKDVDIINNEELSLYVETNTNNILKGIHLLDVIDTFAKDITIPVTDDRIDVRNAVKTLDPEVPNGTYIRYPFYKQLIQSIYNELQTTIIRYSKDGIGDGSLDSNIIDKLSKTKGIDPWLLKLLMSGSSMLMIYLLHKAMTPFIAEDIMKGVQPQDLNIPGIVALQAIGLGAGYGLEELNKALSKHGKTTVTTTTTQATDTKTDPIISCWTSLIDESNNILILEYVSTYLSTHYESSLAPWLLYEDVYARVIVLYNRITIHNANTTTIRFAPEIDTVVNKHFSNRDLDDFLAQTDPNSFSYSIDYNDTEDVELFGSTFDEVAAALSDFQYIQNAICCVFKYFLNINVDFLKKLKTVLKIYQSNFSVSSDFSNLRSIEAFSDLIRDRLNKIMRDIKEIITDSVKDYNGNINETLACFSVNDFINIILDFLNTLHSDLSAFVDIVMNLYSGWNLDLSDRVDLVIKIKELDYFIDLLDYVIDSMSRCEVENRDDPRAPYQANNYVSNYINPRLKTFPTPSFSQYFEPTPANSYPNGKTITHKGKIYKIGQSPLDTITKDTYVSCQDMASIFSSTYDI